MKQIIYIFFIFIITNNQLLCETLNKKFEKKYDEVIKLYQKNNLKEAFDRLDNMIKDETLKIDKTIIIEMWAYIFKIKVGLITPPFNDICYLPVGGEKEILKIIDNNYNNSIKKNDIYGLLLSAELFFTYSPDEYSISEKYLNKIIKNYPNNELAFYAKLKKITIINNLISTNKNQNLLQLEKILNDYPDNIFTNYAKLHFASLKKSITKNKDNSIKLLNEILISEKINFFINMHCLYMLIQFKYPKEKILLKELDTLIKKVHSYYFGAKIDETIWQLKENFYNNINFNKNIIIKYRKI